MAKVQARGLASEQPLWYSYVKDSVWQGGTIEYSEMQEAAPYWFNGWVALAHQLEDETLLRYVKTFLEHVYASQEPSGYFGPHPFNTSLPTLLWPRYLTMLGLIQYAEADGNERKTICDLIHAFVPYAAEKFANNDVGDPALGGQYGFQHVRWEELVLVLQWLYDNDPRGKERELISLMKTAREHGFSWKGDFFVDNGTFPRTAVPEEEATMANHGVNIAEALKSEVLAWRFTGDIADIDSTYARLDMIWKYHGRPQGIFSTDEYLAGLHPSRGTEFCASVEAMFSLEMMYATLGDPAWADLTEKIAYNAMPAQITADWWSQQYLHQTNQIWVGNHTEGVPWTDNKYANVMGMEPSYPCCTVNHPQGWPKFWSNSFLLADNGTALVHALLGPATLGTTLGNAVDTNVTVDTLYPFGSLFSYTIASSAPYTFYIRIPGWANSESYISVDDQNAVPLFPHAKSALQTVHVNTGVTTIKLNLGMDIEVERRSNNSIAVHRGPLFYAVDLAHNDTTTSALRAPGPLALLHRLPDVPPSDVAEYDNHTRDHTWLPTVPWDIAIDPSTLSFHEELVKQLPYYVWERGAQPQFITATACEITWTTVMGDADWPPQSPTVCSSGMFTVTLWPFGGTELRVGELPTMSTTFSELRVQ